VTLPAPWPEFDPASQTESEYLDGLYSFFLIDLVDSGLYWKTPERQLSFRRQPTIDNRHAIFWHIVSTGNQGERLRRVDFNRCRRIHWIRPLIEQFNLDYPYRGRNYLNWWVSSRRGNPRYMLVNSDFTYVTIVEERNSYALLITAFPIEYDHRRDKMRREHEGYWNRQEPPA
jgi:hypothetical protein